MKFFPFLRKEVDLTDRIFTILLLAGTILLLAKVILTGITGLGNDHVTASWTALALDLKNGTFYRPLFSEIGTGGTRFFPLYFSLQALIMNIVDKPFLAGNILSIIIGVFLFTAVNYLLKGLGTDRRLSFFLFVLALATLNIQVGIESIRGDILPVAFNCFGIGLYLNSKSKFKIQYVALFFVLAFATKMTSVHGLATLFIVLFLNKNYQEALRLLFYTMGGALLCLLLFNVLSHGVFLQTFIECSTGGGFSLKLIMQAPYWFLKQLILYDPILLLILFMVLLFSFDKNDLKSIPAVLLMVTVAITLFIYTSEGTDINHMADLTIAGIVLLGYTMSTTKTPAFRSFKKIFAFIMLFSLILRFSDFKEVYHFMVKKPDNSLNASVDELLKTGKSSYLAEDPTIPLLRGDVPYILDAFMLRVILKNNDEIRNKLFLKIENKEFAVIILEQNPAISEWYQNIHFGQEFMNCVNTHYTFQKEINGRILLYPK